jgi:nucleoside-diphosphate-sugar epimerase
VILHLAAVIPPLADRDPQYAETVNVGGTKKLLDAARRSSKPVRFIYTSSISVYGDRVASPWIEVGDPLRPSPHDRYAVTKIRAEELVQGSGLAWSIFRLTGVLRPDMSLDPLMFHMPLETSLEILTCRDCGYAVVQAIEVEAVDGRIFNLGGGPRCRTTYRDCLENVFSRVGLGERFFPDEAFAGGNFHCGFYRDSDELEALLGFQREGLDEFYEQVADHLHPAARTAAAASRRLVRWFLLSQSDPWIARRRKDRSMLDRFRCVTGAG